MKKTISSVLVVATLLLFLLPICAINANATSEVSPDAEEYVIDRAEVTQWYYRHNPITGAPEMRLWSITYGYWKTDWLPMS